MNRTGRLFILGVLGVAAIYFVFLAMRARSNLVSLDVRDADLRSVVRRIEWQTWKDIHVAAAVQGRITVKVKKTPLEDVLRILAQQTRSRSTTVYPIYSSRASLREFEQVVLGERPATQSRWKAWQSQSFPDFGRFANALRNENQVVNAQFEGKDVQFAALALSRFSRAQIVPEDAITGKITLQLKQATLPEAVAEVARQAHRKWTVFHLLSPGLAGRAASLPDNRDARAVNLSLGLLPGGVTTNLDSETKAALDEQFEARLATLTPAESNRAVQIRERTDLLRSLPLDQRLEAIQKLMSNPETQTRIRDGVMNRIKADIRDATPDQRVQGTRALTELQEKFQAPQRKDSN